MKKGELKISKIEMFSNSKKKYRLLPLLFFLNFIKLFKQIIFIQMIIFLYNNNYKLM